MGKNALKSNLIKTTAGLLSLLIIYGIYLNSCYYPKLNSATDAAMKISPEIIFAELCINEESECANTVTAHFDTCKKVYYNEFLTAFAARKEFSKFINETYHCIEQKSGYHLPNIWDHIISRENNK